MKYVCLGVMDPSSLKNSSPSVTSVAIENALVSDSAELAILSIPGHMAGVVPSLSAIVAAQHNATLLPCLDVRSLPALPGVGFTSAVHTRMHPRILRLDVAPAVQETATY